MRLAYVHKNFRDLSFEKRVIMLCHVLTAVSCFFPWFESTPQYQRGDNYMAIQGNGFLIGLTILTISLCVVLYFSTQLFEKKEVKLPGNENYWLGGASLQQIILIIMLWSVFLMMREYYDGAIRFGAFTAFTAQIVALVAVFLNYQLGQQQQARAFFQHPEVPKPPKPRTDE